MKNFLLIIDVQQGFVVEGANDNIIERIDNLIRNKVFDCVISMAYKNSPDNHIVKLMGWKKMMNKDEQELVGLTATNSDYIINKSQYSAYSDELLNIMRNENDGILPECVYIVGFDTECCVLKTAVDFFEAGIRPILLSYYCGASSGNDSHIAGLKSLESLIGKNNIYDQEIKNVSDLQKIIEQTQKSYCTK